ncbi:MAG: class I SAM-dependent methyltransferase [Myxococcota bacterium]
MAKTGEGERLGTAEGAVLGRAQHTLHAADPVLRDTWALALLGEASRAIARDPEHETKVLAASGIDFRLILAVGMGALRYAEDEVERCIRAGIDQYVVLGAGFDTFALRREDLADRVRVFEVDFPDVQALKRRRIEAAGATPAQVPTFVPIDFETTKVSETLPDAGFDTMRPSVWSWMNTIPYVTVEATEATLADVRTLMAPGSRLCLNYQGDVPLTDAQATYLEKIGLSTRAGGEPWVSRWRPERFEAVVAARDFRLVEHATEADLNDRYYAGRADGLHAGVPARLVTLEVDGGASGARA